MQCFPHFHFGMQAKYALTQLQIHHKSNLSQINTRYYASPITVVLYLTRQIQYVDSTTTLEFRIKCFKYWGNIYIAGNLFNISAQVRFIYYNDAINCDDKK